MATSDSPSPFWTLDRLRDALADELALPGPAGDRPLGGVETDTRALTRGAVFVALSGERFDAHDFLAQAVAAGAAAVVVRDAERAAGLGVPAFVVRDPLTALGALARYRRRAWGKPVVVVAGSNGKTTTKELLRAALGAAFTVHATAGNLNNLVGVPLTLLALPDAADVAVVEVGTNTPGEVATLRAIAEPDVAVITSVGEEHLEGFGDLAGVLAEEASAADGVAIAVTPAAQPELAEAVRPRARRVVVTGLGAGEPAATAWGLKDTGTGWMTFAGVPVTLPLPGVHNLANAALALATADALGVELGAAAEAIGRVTLPPMRSALVPMGRALLLNDCYNANPPSMRAALDVLDALPPGRQRVAVLGGMRELGSQADALHDAVARRALASSADVIAGVEAMAAALRRVAPGDARVVVADDVEPLWPVLAPRLAPDAVVLLKASRGVRLERLVPRLESWAGVATAGAPPGAATASPAPGPDAHH
ncbi:MAG: UDP-N-acetylmuramoyl-tripeptide--D-alanyl-D-alanine ligase [Gemmatimonadota bacterium]|jgi:UDP-N-acetylmuramoyl-tripeptide--D-alanyl-D-alanine ligase|nr:UDP-N-acetylmuramoyl-tripeptide--D-alanyl-D-alanine ligase [Gemmatimonadota bacterium]